MYFLKKNSLTTQKRASKIEEKLWFSLLFEILFIFINSKPIIKF